MTRNIKMLGLALVAVFALSAVVAQAAMAEGKLTLGTGGIFPAELQGKQTNTNILKIGIREVSCEGAALSGNLTEAEANVGMATVHPVYTSCVAGGGLPAEVTTTGCNYTLTGTGGAPPKNPREFSVEVKCETEGKTAATDGVIIHVYNAAKTEKVCEYKITDGTVVSGGQATNSAGDAHYAATHVHLAIANRPVAGIDVLFAKSALICGATTGSTIGGTYNGELAAQAFNSGTERGLMVE